MDKITFNSGQFSLVREDREVGDHGGMLISIDPNTGLPVGNNGDVIVGCRIKCGSLYARSYQQQDWWMTSVVQDINKVNDNIAIITTRNNTYYVGDYSGVIKYIHKRIDA